MSTLQEHISVIGCFQGVLLFILLIADARVTTASRILGVMCLIIAFIFLIPFLLVNAEIEAIAWTIGFVFYCPVALAHLDIFTPEALFLKHHWPKETFSICSRY